MIQRLNLNEIDSVIKGRFISPIHYDGLLDFMKSNNMIVAFRAAGRYSLDKLTFGAAPKPHTILDKTVKPAELGLNNENIFLFSQTGALRIDDEAKVKNLLCGLVGRRKSTADGESELIGVYLSSAGAAEFADCGIPVRTVGQTRQGYIEFDSPEELFSWILSIFINEPAGDYSKLRYFITGDYDMHEILIAESDGKAVHMPSDSQTELRLLCGLSEAAMSGIMERTGAAGISADGNFLPEEFSPIQHGAQDNYVEHSLIKEQDHRIVEGVALPSLDIAIYNGIDDSWTLINNEAEAENNRIHAHVVQSAEISEYLGVWGAQIAAQWNLQDDSVLASLLNECGRSYFETILSYMQ